MEQFCRTELLIGKEKLDSLKHKHVIIFGIGGVGGYVTEALVRAGIGEITLVDNDIVSESNLNRQIIALHSTVGKFKVDVMAERALDINPNLIVHKCKSFVLPENIFEFDFSLYDYIVDCIDTVSTKISIIEKVTEVYGGVAGVSPAKRGSEQPQPKDGDGSEGKAFPIITCLGTGNKMNPMEFKISLIEKTSVCPLAKVMRRELKNRNIRGIKCVYSEEIPIKSVVDENNFGRHSPGSISFVPPAAGLLIASEVIKDLIN